MEFDYLGKKYLIVELKDPFKNEFYDIIQIMEVEFDLELEMENYKFINYFYGASLYEEDEILEIAKEYIDKKEGKKI